MTRAALACIGALGQLVLLTSDHAASPRILLHPDAEPPLLLPAPAGFAWPTWLGDGSALSVSTVEYPAASALGPRLLRVAVAGAALTELYQDPLGTALVGPRTPHYVNPSPDGSNLLALVPGRGSLRLVFLDGAARGPGQTIAHGSPLFSAWSPNGDAFLLHTGAELTLTDLATAPAARSLAINHVGYRVPAWSPDGELFAVSVPTGRRATLELWDRDGVPARSLGPSWNGAAIAWSPDGALIAQAALARPDAGRYTNLQVVPAKGGQPRHVYDGECAAFLWSPDGTRLALLVPGVQEGLVAWTVIDREGVRIRRFPDFDPSPEFSLHVTFFDQYALSHRLWAPDGRGILACGRVPSDGLPPDAVPSCIYDCDLASGETRFLAHGSIAFWPAPAG